MIVILIFYLLYKLMFSCIIRIEYVYYIIFRLEAMFSNQLEKDI